MTMPDDARFQFSVSCLHVVDMLAPVEETVRGVRDRLKSEQGWSPEAAEHIALATFDAMMLINLAGIETLLSQGMSDGAGE